MSKRMRENQRIRAKVGCLCILYNHADVSSHDALTSVNKRDEDEYEWKAKYLFGFHTIKDVYNSITIVSIRNWYGT